MRFFQKKKQVIVRARDHEWAYQYPIACAGHLAMTGYQAECRDHDNLWTTVSYLKLRRRKDWVTMCLLTDMGQE